jgi:hypothetical protein
MFKTKVDEAAYVGNIGIMELIKFKQKATPEQKKKFDDLLAKKKNKEVWSLVQDVTGVKLHKSIHEEQKKDILPVAGAGQWGTDELRAKYQRETPGQKVKSFTEYNKTK